VRVSGVYDANIPGVFDEDIDPEELARHVDKVFAAFGEALHRAQVVEDAILTVAATTGKLDGLSATWHDFFADIESLWRLTLGNLRSKLLERRHDFGQFDEQLDCAVKLRNFLAHSYFRERGVAITTRAGRDKVIAELNDAVAFFEVATARLELLLDQSLDELGVGPLLPGARERLVNKGFGDPLPGL
jgi:hypothetical protein